MSTPNEAAHVAELERKVAELTAENARLIGGDVKRLCIEAGHLEADIHGGLGVKILAHMLGAYFRKAGAVNFATVDVTDMSVEDDPLCLSVTIQRKGGTSAADRIGTLEDKVKALQAECEAWREVDELAEDDCANWVEYKRALNRLSQARAATDEKGALT